MNCTKNRRRTMAGSIPVLASAVWALWCMPARALELTANESVADGILTGVANGTATAETIRTNNADAALFRWSDANGDGTAVPVSAGLYLKGKELQRTTDSIGIKLDLFNGTANGVLDGSTGSVNAGKISTVRSDATGGILITNAANVKVLTLDTHCSTDYKVGGNIDILGSGNVEVGSLITGEGSLKHTPGRITVRHSGNFMASLLFDNVGSSNARLVGPMTVSGDGSGSCEIGSIRHTSYNNISGPITIENYTGVTIGSAGIDAHTYVAGANSLFIRNIGTGGVNIAGDILTYQPGLEGADYNTYYIYITNIAGRVSVGNIDMHCVNWTLTGQHHRKVGGLIVSCTGDVTLGNLTTYSGSTDGNTDIHPGGNITITSSTGRITVGNMDGRAARPISGSHGGNVSLTAFRDISVTGTVINLDALYSASQRGTLSLTTTAGGGGRIYVGATTNAVLDMNLLLTATLNSDAKRTDLAGVLANFDATSTNGSGTATNPFVTTQTKLRVPSDQRVYYKFVPGVLNDALGGYAYRVANTGGTNGTGGLLMVEPKVGTLMCFK